MSVEKCHACKEPLDEEKTIFVEGQKCHEQCEELAYEKQRQQSEKIDAALAESIRSFFCCIFTRSMGK